MACTRIVDGKHVLTGDHDVGEKFLVWPGSGPVKTVIVGQQVGTDEFGNKLFEYDVKEGDRT
jgi:hypothetical protein